MYQAALNAIWNSTWGLGVIFFLVTAQTISSKYVLDSMRYAQLQ